MAPVEREKLIKYYQNADILFLHLNKVTLSSFLFTNYKAFKLSFLSNIFCLNISGIRK